MAIVIELQGFWHLNINNNFVVKEFCMVSLDTHIFAHCFLKPPQHQCSTILDTSPCHGLQWNDGYINYQDGIQMLKDISLADNTIYVKGNNYCIFISRITQKESINLDSMGTLPDFQRQVKFCWALFLPTS